MIPGQTTKQRLKNLLLYPLLVYLIISVEIAVFVALGLETDTLWVWVVTTGFVTALLIVFAAKAKPSA